MPAPNIAPNPNTLGDVIARCQSLMGDRLGSWVTPAYVTPLINQAYEGLVKEIKNASGKNLEAVIEILNVGAGISSLYQFQRYGNPQGNPPIPNGPLVGLFNPLRMWVKTAGSLPQYYTQAIGPRDTLYHINPPGITPGTYAVRVTFAWIGNKLSMTPVAGPTDIQVYGRFNPPRLVNPTDELVIYGDCTSTVALRTCGGMIGVERANPQIVQGYAAQAIAETDNIVADIIRQCQREPRRLAKMGGNGGGSGTMWGWG